MNDGSQVSLSGLKEPVDIFIPRIYFILRLPFSYKSLTINAYEKLMKIDNNLL